MNFGKNFKFYVLACLSFKFYFTHFVFIQFYKCMEHIGFNKKFSLVSVEFIQIYYLQTSIAKNDWILDWIYWIDEWFFRQCPY